MGLCVLSALSGNPRVLVGVFLSFCLWLWHCLSEGVFLRLCPYSAVQTSKWDVPLLFSGCSSCTWSSHAALAYAGFVPCGGWVVAEVIGRQAGIRDPFCFPLAVRWFYWILHLFCLFLLSRSHANTGLDLVSRETWLSSGSLKCTNCFALSLPLMS